MLAVTNMATAIAIDVIEKAKHFFECGPGLLSLKGFCGVAAKSVYAGLGGIIDALEGG